MEIFWKNKSPENYVSAAKTEKELLLAVEAFLIENEDRVNNFDYLLLCSSEDNKQRNKISLRKKFIINPHIQNVIGQIKLIECPTK